MALTPFFKNPLTDITGSLFTHQELGHCTEMEMKVINCFEAYGIDRAATKCSDAIEDFKECFQRTKQRSRVFEMRSERYHQIESGERPKDKMYAPEVDLDSFQ